MNKIKVIGAVLCLGGLAVAGITWTGYQEKKAAQARDEALISAKFPDQPDELPKFDTPIESWGYEGRDLRAYVESGDEGAEAELVTALTKTLAKLAARGDTTGQVRQSSVVVSEEQRRQFAQLLIDRYGEHERFDPYPIQSMIQEHVNEGAIDWEW